MCFVRGCLFCEFLSTLSLRRATRRLCKRHCIRTISIHALLAESDDDLEPSNTRRLTFLSTLSLRRATKPNKLAGLKLVFLSTLSLRRATYVPVWALRVTSISIHALLAESDIWLKGKLYGRIYFYPRSPCGERLSALAPKQNPTQHFYPRSPCGERRRAFYDTAQHTYFYPRSPCGERLQQ